MRVRPLQLYGDCNMVPNLIIHDRMVELNRVTLHITIRVTTKVITKVITKATNIPIMVINNLMVINSLTGNLINNLISNLISNLSRASTAIRATMTEVAAGQGRTIMDTVTTCTTRHIAGDKGAVLGVPRVLQTRIGIRGANPAIQTTASIGFGRGTGGEKTRKSHGRAAGRGGSGSLDVS